VKPSQQIVKKKQLTVQADMLYSQSVLPVGNGKITILRVAGFPLAVMAVAAGRGLAFGPFVKGLVCFIQFKMNMKQNIIIAEIAVTPCGTVWHVASSYSSGLRDCAEYEKILHVFAQ